MVLASKKKQQAHHYLAVVIMHPLDCGLWNCKSILVWNLLFLSNTSYVWKKASLSLCLPVVLFVMDVETTWVSEHGMAIICFSLIKQLDGVTDVAVICLSSPRLASSTLLLLWSHAPVHNWN